MLRFFVLQVFLIAWCVAFSQIPGTWSTHFCYRYPSEICEGDGVIYCAVDNAVIAYDKESREVQRLTKADVLTSVGVSAIAYDADGHQLIVGYADGSVDLVSSAGTITVPDLRFNKLIPQKKINKIDVKGRSAYLSADFGIAKLNLDELEFEDTYFLGTGASFVKVFNLDWFNNRIYAATEEGLFSAPAAGANLADFNFWEIMETDGGDKIDDPVRFLAANGDHLYYASFPDSTGYTLYKYSNGVHSVYKTQIKRLACLEVFQGKLHVSGEYSIYVYDENDYQKFKKTYDDNPNSNVYYAFTDSEGKLWGALSLRGLVDVDSGNEILPNGTFYDQVADMQFVDDEKMLVAFGQNGTFRYAGYGVYSNNWLTQVFWQGKEGRTIVPDPANEGGFYFGTVTGGLAYFDSFYGIQSVYNTSNSLLDDAWTDVCQVLDAKVDKHGNLWVANWNAEDALKILDAEGEWHSYKHPGQKEKVYTNEILITRDNYKWVVDGSRYPVYVLDDNGTIDDTSDDRFTYMHLQGDEQTVFANAVHALAEDEDGAIWAGTDNGIAVYSNPREVFSQSQAEFRRVKVEVDSIIDYMLDGIEILSLCIDHGNRKWVGTSSNGVFLLSASGDEVLKHFTAQDSPLPSDFVQEIAIRPSDGAVFFATDKGLVEYLGDATMPVQKMEDIAVVPNPVRPDYKGDVYIKGLVDDALVKITDVAGNLVFETYSFGGMAVWDGRNLIGKRPQTGVYLIFVSDTDGQETRVGKLMFIN